MARSMLALVAEGDAVDQAGRRVAGGWPSRLASSAAVGIDTATGEVRFDGLGLTVGPSMTLSSFRAHSASAGFEEHSPNAGYVNAHAPVSVDGEPFVAELAFDGERLSGLRLMSNQRRFRDLSSGSASAEQRAFHDAWLRRALGWRRLLQRPRSTSVGVAYRYRWGRVGSFLHPQDMNPVIVLSYAPPASSS
jgi:hypothetical protein